MCAHIHWPVLSYKTEPVNADPSAFHPVPYVCVVESVIMGQGLDVNVNVGRLEVGWVDVEDVEMDR